MDTIAYNLEGFVWDQGNSKKSLEKHGVAPLAAEEAFFNFNLLSPDPAHSQHEPRYRLLGQANNGNVLFIIFTVRSSKIRVISSRLANKNERSIYEQAAKGSS